MKRKGMWVVVSVLVVLSLLIGGFGCASTTAPGQATVTKTVTTTATGKATLGIDLMPDEIPLNSVGTADWEAYWPSTKGKVVGINTPIRSYPLQGKIYLEGIMNLAEEQLWGLEWIITDAEMDVSRQIQQMEGYIAQDVDLVLAQPIDPYAVGATVRKLQDAGIPVINFNSVCCPPADINISHCPQRQGWFAGEWMAKELNGKGKVAIILGTPNDFWSNGRRAGFEMSIAQYPDMEIVAALDDPSGPFTEMGGYRVAKTLIATYPDLDGIYTCLDRMSVGAGTALRTEGRAPNVLIAGSDGELEGFRGIRDGIMDMTCAYNGAQQVQTFLAAVITLLTSPGYEAGTLCSIYWSEHRTITKDNVMEETWPLY